MNTIRVYEALEYGYLCVGFAKSNLPERPIRHYL